jgi:transcriptional regulator with XRE-family HTH domain
VEIKTEDINQALAAELRAAKGAAKLSVRVLVERSGLATATLNRMLNGERDIKVSQLYLLADALGVSPVQLVERAVERARGMEAATTDEQRVSSAPSNVTPLRPSTAEDLDKYAGPRAAYRDEEADTDEPE